MNRKTKMTIGGLVALVSYFAYETIMMHGRMNRLEADVNKFLEEGHEAVNQFRGIVTDIEFENIVDKFDD